MTTFDRWVEQAKGGALPLQSWASFDPLLELAARRQIVLIGEMSHGTHESFVLRSKLTELLIKELGFTVIFLEADRLDAAELDQSVRFSYASLPIKVLEAQRQWPSWLWSNTETAEFGNWLREFNSGKPREGRVSICGLDFWPLWAATREVIAWLSRHHSSRVNMALDAPLLGRPMVENIGTMAEYLVHQLGLEPADEAICHYRKTLTGGTVAMNARAEHWLKALLNRVTENDNVVVWAHNTHVGDSDGVLTGDREESFGHRVRQHFGADRSLLVGFAGGRGRVMAAPQRGAAMGTFRVPEPQSGSLESILYQAAKSSYALFLASGADWERAVLPHRAIGAVYAGRSDLYVPTQWGIRYDALMWSRVTTPVDALHLEEALNGQLPVLRTP